MAAVVVDADLGVRAATWRVARAAVNRWRLLAADGSADLTVELDEAGMPVFDGGQRWPLERDPAG